MYGAGTTQSNITFNTGTTAFLNLYAPYCNLTINAGCDMYGSFLCKNITVQNGTSISYARIHNDRGLTKQSVSFNVLTQW